MRLSTLDRYGLRCLVQIGRHQEHAGEGLTIPEISRAEGLSISSVAKVMRILRIGGSSEASAAMPVDTALPGRPIRS